MMTSHYFILTLSYTISRSFYMYICQKITTTTIKPPPLLYAHIYFLIINSSYIHNRTRNNNFIFYLPLPSFLPLYTYLCTSPLFFFFFFFPLFLFPSFLVDIDYRLFCSIIPLFFSVARRPESITSRFTTL